MNIQGKVWGTTSPIFLNNNVEINRIECLKGGRCSKHMHQSKYNMFFVESGKMKIETWKNDYELIDEVILEAQHSTIVKPREYHRFTCLEPAVVYEIYWVTLLDTDIVRDDVGGVIQDI